MEDAVRQRIETLLAEHPVCLFMKGSRLLPQCGFSGEIVSVLDTALNEYHTVNVLEEEELREAIKEYSQWPTIPQLYLRGEFVGGADIIKQLYQQGKLRELLGDLAVEPTPPTLSVSFEAIAAFRGFLEKPEERVRLQISPNYEHGLSVGPAQPGDLEVHLEGVTLVLDPQSARRAEGLVISLRETANGPAFKIDNPNAPPEIKPLQPKELAELRESGKAHRLIDVRTEAERATANIEGSEHLTQELLDELLEGDKDALIVFQCHHGIRSRRAADGFVLRGFRNIYNLEGGIDAWSEQVDARVPRY